MDSTGPRQGQQRPVRIRLTLIKEGDRLRFDFGGTEPQQEGNVNAVEAVTVSAVAFAVRAATDPTIPANGGALRPVSVVAPPGSLVAARPPAAVGAGNVEVAQRVADVCLRALAEAAPGRLGAGGQGTMNNLILGGASGWVYYETVGGGQGGRPPRPDGPTAAAVPGQSGIHTGHDEHLGHPDRGARAGVPGAGPALPAAPAAAGGAGLAPGGEGIERVIQVLEPATLSLITERRRSRPYGLAGGEPGSTGENWLWPEGDESRRVPLADKLTIELAAGRRRPAPHPRRRWVRGPAGRLGLPLRWPAM